MIIFTSKIDAFLKKYPEYEVSEEGSSYRGKRIYMVTGPCMKPTLGREPNILKAMRKAVREACKA